MRPDGELKFHDVSRVNENRCRVWHTNGLREWSLLEWAGAMCGEAGEAANIAKKIRRVEQGIQQKRTTATRVELVEKLKKEIGDTLLYLDLLASAAGLTLEECTRHAFNEVSEREGWPHRL